VKVVARAALVLGLGTMALLIVREGPQPILVLLSRVGWVGLLLAAWQWMEARTRRLNRASP
jgi:hypothetical protein